MQIDMTKQERKAFNDAKAILSEHFGLNRRKCTKI